MTQEFIGAIRQRQKDRQKFLHDQEEALKAWDEDNLKPYTDACDHTYPWGETAVAWKYGMPTAGYPKRGDYGECRICFTHQER